MQITKELLREAMQEAWQTTLEQTKFPPVEFTLDDDAPGKITADFSDDFAERVLVWLEAKRNRSNERDRTEPRSGGAVSAHHAER